MAAGVPEPFVTVEDCEKVTRQLQFALEVDGVEYKRLEVSSPGIDRPLRNEQDFERFVGAVIDMTLKAPMGAAAGGQVSANRKKFRGTLERAEGRGGRRRPRLANRLERCPRTQAWTKSEQEARACTVACAGLRWTSCATRGSRRLWISRAARPKRQPGFSDIDDGTQVPD
jgi:ribosome maturation factor RimP